ncbi:hypothetical protein BGZ54_005894 [Gamsiella multidivaricata]|nr:hypothetical protein BGZ54_005894 [Gamsiella multidivaricata]
MGGHFSILGIPAMAATVIFIGRIRWLKQHKRPHGYGRTGLIYWPSQFLILGGCFALLGLAFSLATGPYLATADGLLMNVMVILRKAWYCEVREEKEIYIEVTRRWLSRGAYMSSWLAGALPLIGVFGRLLAYEDVQLYLCIRAQFGVQG